MSIRIPKANSDETNKQDQRQRSVKNNETEQRSKNASLVDFKIDYNPDDYIGPSSDESGSDGGNPLSANEYGSEAQKSLSDNEYGPEEHNPLPDNGYGSEAQNSPAGSSEDQLNDEIVDFKIDFGGNFEAYEVDADADSAPGRDHYADADYDADGGYYADADRDLNNGYYAGAGYVENADCDADSDHYADDDYDDYDYDYEDYEFEGAKRTPFRRILGKIFLVLQALVSGGLIAVLYVLNALPNWVQIMVTAAIAVLWALVFVSQLKRRHKGQIIGMIFSGFMCLVLGVSAFYLVKTNSMLDKITGEALDIRTYYVAVLYNNEAESIEDAKDYAFAVQDNFESETLEKVIAEIKADINDDIITVGYDTPVEQAEALAHKEVDAIIYNEEMTSAMEERYPKFQYATKIIKTITITSESDVSAIDIDVSKEPFLVFVSGTDNFGFVTTLVGRSDVNILAAINPNTYEVLLITIPRDYYVEFPGITQNGERDKLTHAGIYGMNELISTVEYLLDCDINYYIRMNFSSLLEIVDAIGGVEIDNEQEFTSIDGFYYPEGHLSLGGLEALNYVRERHAFEDGDFARGRHQVQMIQAMLDQMTSSEGIAKYTAATDAIATFARTNIPKSDITSLIKLQLNKNPQWHIVSYQMLGDVIYQPCQAMGYQYLSVDMPYTESIDNAKILLLQVLSGTEISEDLQLIDDGTLTYAAVPIE